MRRKITRMMAARLNSGLTQSQVAEAIGVTQPRISIWESGNTDIPWVRRVQIGDLLEVSPDRLDESALWMDESEL